MSCRIDRVVNNENLVVLFISGRITGEDVDMLWGVLARESGGFAIDLENVLLVDREAVKLLALSEANGTELRNCPPYIREWVTRERAETHAHPSEYGLEEGRTVDDCSEAHLASISRLISIGEGASAFELQSFRRMVWGDVGQPAPRQNSWLGNLRVLACFQGCRLGSRVAPVGLKGMVTANCPQFGGAFVWRGRENLNQGEFCAG